MSRPWVLAVVFALAACSNAAHEQQQRLHDICVGLVPGTTTLAQAGQAFGGLGVIPVACRSDYKKIPDVANSDDQCPHDNVSSVCSLVYEFITTDNCPGISGGTCANYCEVRLVPPTAQSSVLCARQWLPGQPILDAPPARPAP